MPVSGDPIIEATKQGYDPWEPGSRHQRSSPPDVAADFDERLRAGEPASFAGEQMHSGEERCRRDPEALRCAGRLQRKQMESVLGKETLHARGGASATGTVGVVEEPALRITSYCCFSIHRNTGLKKRRPPGQPSSLPIFSPSLMNLMTAGVGRASTWPYQALMVVKKSRMATSRSWV